ncbi:MAG: efflux RND transporter periplasmic adaptor subunit [Gammaproteobacteria bacterium]|nr:efflux RND transporter periplasmic adaptor subunit [Gammaproteobacteria bacterium]
MPAARILKYPAVALFLVTQLAHAGEVACFGRIQPNGGVVNVGAPSADTIMRVLVSEGRQVKTGDVLAILGSHGERQGQLEQAQLALAQAELERDSGMELEREKYRNLKEGHGDASQRLESLYANKAEEYVSPDYIAGREEEIADYEQRLKLSSLEMRKLERSAELNVARAQKQAAMAEAALEEATVRSPLDGRILKVLGRPGEQAGPVLFMLGDTSSMFVLAEVYESDALRVKAGQKAEISSAALPAKLTGTVESMGTMVYRSTLESLAAAPQTGARVVEALIRLEANAYSDRLINLQVDVVIRE